MDLSIVSNYVLNHPKIATALAMFLLVNTVLKALNDALISTTDLKGFNRFVTVMGMMAQYVRGVRPQQIKGENNNVKQPSA